ncbi:MAG: T9SS type A sorting domain-containing protein [Haliscomenobacter sp.]|nr:T9SS type A sorting domain-containing protein [Haliscomenobacter sp.]
MMSLQRFFPCLLFLFGACTLSGQQYTLTVENGYGSGQYAPGDTVHIWAEEWLPGQTFKNWTGQTVWLKSAEEWHTTLLMPARNITVRANKQDLPQGANFTQESIRGRDTLKRVYHYFPAGQPKGVVWLFHGTNGSAATWVNVEFEQRQFANYLMAAQYAVVVTESEEVTYGRDLFGNDGVFRYDYSPDTLLNVDIANIRALRDTFIRRGWITPSTLHAAEGFSAGGAFSTLLATVLGWKAGITHCAPPVYYLVSITQTPLLASMNLLDAHPDVGQEGNVDAYQAFDTLTRRGNCAQFYLLRPSPVYPERFKRLSTINGVLSQAIFNELKNNHCLNAAHYVSKAPAVIEALVASQPSNWPVMVSLTTVQRNFVLDQIDVMWTSHHFHTDFMGADLAFIERVCGAAVGTNERIKDVILPPVFPNPSSGLVFLPEFTHRCRVFDVYGRLLLEKSGDRVSELDISSIPVGLYFLEMYTKAGRHTQQLIKQP